MDIHIFCSTIFFGVWYLCLVAVLIKISCRGYQKNCFQSNNLTIVARLSDDCLTNFVKGLRNIASLSFVSIASAFQHILFVKGYIALGRHPGYKLGLNSGRTV